MAAGLRSIIPGMGTRKSETTEVVDADTCAADLETVEVAVPDSTAEVVPQQ